MALIQCLDCGRKVSDAALACPACARPVALSVSAPPPAATPVAREPSRSSVTSPLAPGALSAFQQVVKDSRTTAIDAPRMCVECGGDVSRDAFRLKRGDGYICMDCQDEEADRVKRRAAYFRTLRTSAMVLFLLIGLTTLVVNMVSTSPPPAPRANKR